jgi:AraC-like DNA-binding protein
MRAHPSLIPSPAATTERPGPPLTQAQTAATPVAFVGAILRAYQRYGKSPAAALAAAQIEPGLLENPQNRISAWQMERISGHAMHELNDESLGWSRRPLPWGSYGMLVRASLSAPTLGVALKRWCRHHGLICDDLALQLSRGPEGACITLQLLRPLGDLQEFCMVSLLRNLHGVACWLVDSRIALKRVEFGFAAPAHAEVYALLFPGPVSFGGVAGEAALHLEASYLDLPLARDEKALQQMLQRALPLTVHQYRRDRLLVQQARQALRLDPQGTHSAAALATKLNLSARGLHRQLQEEGTTLQVLKDEVRLEAATTLLQRTRKPIKQVAEAAGFLNEKSFARAFKTWTGQTPSAFRQAARPAALPVEPDAT